VFSNNTWNSPFYAQTLNLTLSATSSRCQVNQNIIKDSGKLILADNADRKIYSNNIPTKNFR
jgi:hypothetical protein